MQWGAYSGVNQHVQSCMLPRGPGSVAGPYYTKTLTMNTDTGTLAQVVLHSLFCGRRIMVGALLARCRRQRSLATLGRQLMDGSCSWRSAPARRRAVRMRAWQPAWVHSRWLATAYGGYVPCIMCLQASTSAQRVHHLACTLTATPPTGCCSGSWAPCH